MKPRYEDAVERTGVMKLLAAFDPHIAGTPPLSVDLPASDIDILCHAPNPLDFTIALWSSFSTSEEFRIHQWLGQDRAVIASFSTHGWRFEIFGQDRPVAEQAGWRHFVIERRLLQLGGSAFRKEVLRMRRQGLKTEPAFARLLGLKGDPYRALLDIDACTDDRLLLLLAAAGFGPET